MGIFQNQYGISQILYKQKEIQAVYYKNNKVFPDDDNLNSSSVLGTASLNYVGGDSANYWDPATSLNYTISEAGYYEIDCEFIYKVTAAFNGRVFSQIQGWNGNTEWWLSSDNDPTGGFRILNIQNGIATLKMYAGVQFTTAD